MENEKRTKWDIGVVIDKGNQSVALTEKYPGDILPRLQPDELEQHKANIKELEARRAGQKETLVDQKSKTLSQDDSVRLLFETASSIRTIIRSCNPPDDILKSFGVGEKLSKTVDGAIATGNIIINGYKTNTDWSKNAGIIEADITQIQDLITWLNQANAVQETSKFTRKSKTMDKNTLQRTVEDEVTKIAALGAHVFRSKNPAVAALFEGLIPTAAKAEAQPQNNMGTTQ